MPGVVQSQATMRRVDAATAAGTNSPGNAAPLQFVTWAADSGISRALACSCSILLWKGPPI